MIVVADTSPINYLLLIGKIDLLPRLFGQIIIPDVVRDEMLDPLAPRALQEWIASPPAWLAVQAVSENDTTNAYKYLFFLSLLDILRRHQFQITAPIPFSDLIVEMLANAWFPHSYFKLSFGSQDKIAQHHDALALVVEALVVQFKDPDKTLLNLSSG